MTRPLSYADVMAMGQNALAPQKAADTGTCVVIGNFDGIHIAHQTLIREGVRTGLPVIAVTFDPHPQAILSGITPERLTDNMTRDALLREAGAVDIVLLAFSKAFADMSPESFILEVLVKRLDIGALVFGHDFTLGKGGVGNADVLHALGRRYDFMTRQVAELHIANGMTVSSTAIRLLLGLGDVACAAQMLGRPYALKGTVIHGKHRGRTLGFPTANLSIPAHIRIPAKGVYATTVLLSGKRYPAVTNIGTNPTFAGADVSIETHIPSFEGDLYGETLTLEFRRKLRDEEKFKSMESLKIQISSDIRKALQR